MEGSGRKEGRKAGLLKSVSSHVQHIQYKVFTKLNCVNLSL